jgi:hypothetical protein
VEVLVPYPPAVRPGGFPTRWQWLTVDPTPGEYGEIEGTTWFTAARDTGAAFFFEYIIGYNAERRKKAVAVAEAWARANGPYLLPAAGVLGVGVLVYGTRWRRPGRRRSGWGGWLARLFGGSATGSRGNARPVEPWFADLMDVLDRHGHPFPVGRTPAEHAEAVGAALVKAGQPETIAEIPRRVTAAFYLARYAGRPPADVAALDADVRALAAALSRGQ